MQVIAALRKIDSTYLAAVKVGSDRVPAGPRIARDDGSESAGGGLRIAGGARRSGRYLMPRSALNEPGTLWLRHQSTVVELNESTGLRRLVGFGSAQQPACFGVASERYTDVSAGNEEGHVWLP